MFDQLLDFWWSDFWQSECFPWIEHTGNGERISAAEEFYQIEDLIM
jgi:hypothetical protein